MLWFSFIRRHWQKKVRKGRTDNEMKTTTLTDCRNFCSRLNLGGNFVCEFFLLRNLRISFLFRFGVDLKKRFPLPNGRYQDFGSRFEIDQIAIRSVRCWRNRCPSVLKKFPKKVVIKHYLKSRDKSIWATMFSFYLEEAKCLRFWMNVIFKFSLLFKNFLKFKMHFIAIFL